MEKTFTVTLRFNENMKERFEQIADFYKMKDRSHKAVLCQLIELGINAYRDDWDESGD